MNLKKNEIALILVVVIAVGNDELDYDLDL